MKHYMPVRLFSGEGAVEKNAALFASFGDRCALVTGKRSAVKSGALADVTAALEREGVAFCVFDGVGPNPSVASCIEAGRTAHEFGAAFVVGIGGGSALDAAKAAAVFAANPGLDEEGFYQKRWDRAPLPILLVGTTAGTGSEATKVSVLTDSRGRKHSIHDDRLFAAAAFGEAKYTASLSLPVTLSTGIDVLSHCAESFFNRNADEISRAFAVRGVRLLYAPLRKAAAGGELELSDRAALYEASLLGGLAICDTGTCFAHNVGYYLTENRGVPHGFASAIFLPALLELVKKKDPAYAERFFRETGLGKAELLELVGLCLPENAIRMTEEEIAAALPRWENNNSVRNTCCAVSTAEIRNILEQLFLKN
ncbi:MAG: iron-containing alcohol dehydrogenase [Oscillospiraceae bacterium]|nr:iron-containing alcohol dehydrogenase [Oscillospiraceae bacterium]